LNWLLLPPRRGKILITDKCTMTHTKWRDKGESLRFRVDPTLLLRLGRYFTTLQVAVCIKSCPRKHQLDGYENEDRAQALAGS
jgi:hypothetical protein